MFTPIDPNSLDILSNDRDVLRDLFVYLDYARERSIKRMTRSNEIPRADLVRLAKLLELDPPEKDEWMYARPHWINFIDTLALRLYLVSYDTKGDYRGYSSSEPTFTENFIVVNEGRLQQFLELSPLEQEKRILEALNRAKSFEHYDAAIFNEFFQYGPLGYLDTFDRWGSASGIMPMLKFPEARLFLLDVLKKCPAGQWLSVQSLIDYLKTNHPYFLIPREMPKPDRWGHTIGRYDNFHEGHLNESRDKTVPPDDPDAFERVEGRYVERFFEYIPLIMRFVDLGYAPEPPVGKNPTLGYLKAFRISGRFLSLMSGEVNRPRVTIQPNFDVIIESDFYPANVIRQVAAFGEQVSNPNSGHGAYVGIFQLKKAAVAAALARQPELDVIGVLKNLCGRDLPGNVQIELEEWAGHADQFTLYEGFSLLEMTDLPPELEKYRLEKISPSLGLVLSSEKVFATLEVLARAPLRIQHADDGFTPLPENIESVFPKEIATADLQKPARLLKVARIITISYRFPDQASFAAICKALAEVRCPFHADPPTCTLSLHQSDQAKFDEALLRLAGEFLIEFE